MICDRALEIDNRGDEVMANYTAKAIMRTFEEMLVEMPFDKITVSAIVTRCEISSNTFYYHFRDIFDLLDAWLTEVRKKLIGDADHIGEWPEKIKTILHAMHDNPEIVYHVFDSISRERFERYIFDCIENSIYEFTKKALGSIAIPDENVRDIAAFCCYSMLGFSMKFIWGRMSADIDSSVDRLSRMFNGVIEYVIGKLASGDVQNRDIFA